MIAVAFAIPVAESRPRVPGAAVKPPAPDDAVRDSLMPINRRWPLRQLMAALRAYPLKPRRRITIEYVLLAGLNDRDEDARRLKALLEGIPVKLNLLPLNAHGQTDLRSPPPTQVEHFAGALRQQGLSALVRVPRGQDIAAACGQLGGPAN